MASLKMPQLGESITEGTIARWLKQPGDSVEKYESIVEIITDKVNAEVPAPFTGILREIKAAEGTTVAVGTEIAVIDAEEAAGTADASPADRSEGQGLEVKQTISEAESISPAQDPPRETTYERPRLSPAVRAFLEQHGLDDAELSHISGTGGGGRVTKKDVENYVARRAEMTTPKVSAAIPDVPSLVKPPDHTLRSVAFDRVEPLSPMRRSIALNMTRSKQTIPHAWTAIEVDMTAVVRIRQQERDQFRQREGVELSFVPIVTKAVVEELRANPTLNASWSDRGVQIHKDINVGIAVSVPDGVIIPVIRGADRLSIAAIARAAETLARSARSGRLTPEDVQGSTFTVNNPGTYGAMLSYSIIPPSQAAILVMDAVVKRPVVLDGDAIAVRSMMNLCLSFDHRILDGVTAARFLQGVRRWLEAFSEKVSLD